VTAELAYGALAEGGSACLQNLNLKMNSLLSGSAVGLSGVKLGRNALVQGLCVTAGAPVSLAPNALCTAGTNTSGMHSLVADCQTAANLAESRRQTLLSLSANQIFPSMTLSTNSTLDVTPFSTAPGALVVIDYASLSLRPNRTLTIKGNAHTEAVIVRVTGSLRLGRNARVVTEGIPPGPNGSPAERVLCLVGGTAELRVLARLEGTIFSQGNLTLRRNAVVTGALISNGSLMRIRPWAQVHQAPWVLW
jgi:hypothetical protein